MNKDFSQDPLVELAKKTIDVYVSTSTEIKPPGLPDDLPARAGCFVSIHIKPSGDLRGCIGTIEPVYGSLAEEVVQNAIAAATCDPRFPPIEAYELERLEISVDVLFPAEPATVDMLDSKRYGVIVTQGYRRGLLLPDLEGVDTVGEQLRIACMKASIDPNSEYSIERFEVVRHT